jgi:hypothetical protein
MNINIFIVVQLFVTILLFVLLGLRDALIVLMLMLIASELGRLSRCEKREKSRRYRDPDGLGEPFTSEPMEPEPGRVPSDFDDYPRQYVPGYSDIHLYNKDGSDPFSPLYRDPSGDGMVRFGGGLAPTIPPEYPESDAFDPKLMIDKPHLRMLMDSEDGCKADNLAGYNAVRMQQRSKESIINQVRKTRDSFDEMYREELDDNEGRDWWGGDNLYKTRSI